jgi:hypothetical protein
MEEKDIKTLEKYISDYNEKVTADNAQQCMENFDENWKTITAYSADDTYGLALVIFSVANYELPNISEKNIAHLSELIYQYDTDDDVKYKSGVKQSLFLNLGLCWHKLGTRYDENAVSAFKKCLFYLLAQSNKNSFANLSLFAFRKCNEYLYKSLINEQLNLSSPSEFNDSFDCPILVLLKMYEDDVNKLILKAYNDSLKVSCFMRNIKLLPEKNENGNWITDDNGNPIYKKKHDIDADEYLNGLMWAHYADFHKGICIKYHFNEKMTNMIVDSDKIISYFRDIKYSDKDMSKYSNKDSISVEDSFFLKGKNWEYENELRYLYFDIDGTGKHKQIDIPNCIEAVYFGVKCSQADKDTIMKILKDQKLIAYDLQDNRTEKDIEFYQIEMDLKHFGQLNAVKL